jgi:glycosyltransferase involved in cell wall biosynthesis
MPRFTNMLADGMQARGHLVKVWSPEPHFHKLPLKAALKKWMGYIDQFIIFPAIVRRRIKKESADTLYVFTDHALGMWVPLAKHLPHVIICHDFLAQHSAKGNVPQNLTGKSGQKYQQLIHKGYIQGTNFISVSNKTREDLHLFLERTPSFSKVVYNGLNKRFTPIETNAARLIISEKNGINCNEGYILHVGGNQWYKNRVGVVKIYNAWRKEYSHQLPLLLVGANPSTELLMEIDGSPYKEDIHVIDDLSDKYINAAYSGASVLLFPSLAEGFGWPIAEGMAAGCPVITTHAAPMTEVGGDAAIYIPAQPLTRPEVTGWATGAAEVLNQVVNLAPAEREEVVAKGLKNAERFNTREALDEMENAFSVMLNNN